MNHGDCFNRPLRAMAISTEIQAPDAPSISINASTNFQPPAATLLSLGQPNLRLMTLKRSEAHPNHWILRCHESAGESASLADAKVGNQSVLHSNIAQSTDLLEQSSSEVPETLTPWQIATFKVSPTMAQKLAQCDSSAASANASAN